MRAVDDDSVHRLSYSGIVLATSYPVKNPDQIIQYFVWTEKDLEFALEF
jgi:hypothetical protein